MTRAGQAQRAGRRAARWPAILGVGMLLATGCGSSGPSGGGSGSPSASAVASTPSGPAGPIGPSASPDDLDQILEFAAGSTDPGSSDLGRLWAEVFERVQIKDQQPYAPPAAVLSYRGGELPATVCADGDVARRWRENAKYCRGDDTVAYDEDWLRSVAAEFSYFAPVTILAHEWGHHVESVVGDSELDIQLELEADCLSGLYATASGLLPHDGDRETELAAMEQALRTWFDLGDERYAESEWLDAGVHGSSQQRMMAFATGATSNIDYPNPKPSMVGGIPWCYGYRDFEAHAYTDIGPYALLNPPGRVVTRNAGVVSLAPETRTSVTTSAVALAWLSPLPIPDVGATEAQLRALWAVGYPDIEPIAPIDLARQAGAGTAAAWYYQNTAPNGDVESGIFALVAPRDATGGLLVLVYRPEPAPADATSPANLDILEDEVATLSQVLGRLCSPDESPDRSAANLDVVCLRDRQ